MSQPEYTAVSPFAQESAPADGFIWARDLPPAAQSLLFGPNGKKLLLWNEGVRQASQINLGHLAALTAGDLTGFGLEPELPLIQAYLGKSGLALAQSTEPRLGPPPPDEAESSSTYPPLRLVG